MGPGAGLPAALHFEIRRDGEPVDPLRLLPVRP
jgi:murein DD-endopeptidase MepM/ murein hydrolase activator NlpD